MWYCYNLPFLGYGYGVQPNATGSFSLNYFEIDDIIKENSVCLTFLYKLSGSHNELSVLIRELRDKPRLIWHLKGNHGDDWQEALITLHPSTPFRVCAKNFSKQCFFNCE